MSQPGTAIRIASGQPERQLGGLFMKNQKVLRMVGIAILAAVVIVLQLLGSFIRFGPVSVSLVLIPIVVGAAMYGPAAGAALGFVFSIVVLLQPDTAFFYGIHFFGTILTVLIKGTLAGYLAGLVFQLVSKKNIWLGVILAAVICPIVNTGLFLLGCKLFFWEALAEEGGGNAFAFVITVMIGFNFIAEFVTNIVCSPVVLRVLQAAKRR